MAIDPRHVRTFREVVRAGSFTGAAQAMGFSQPAVSQQMQALERLLGVPLFVRAGRRLLITEAGHALLAHSERLLAGLAAAEAEVRAIAGMQAGTVRIAAFPSANATLIPRLLGELVKRAPGVSITLIEAEPPQSLEMLRQGECDVAVAFGYEPLDDNGLLLVPLMTDELVVLTRSGDDHDDGERHALADFGTRRWIAGCPRCAAHFVRTCQDAGFEPDIVCATDDNMSVQSLVAVGLGCALMPELVVSFMRHSDIAVLRLENPPRRKVMAYIWPGLERSASVAEVLTGLRAAAGVRPAR